MAAAGDGEYVAVASAQAASRGEKKTVSEMRIKVSLPEGISIEAEKSSRLKNLNAKWFSIPKPRPPHALK